MNDTGSCQGPAQNFSQDLTRLILKKHGSKRAFAQTAGVSPSYVTKITRGVELPSSSTLLAWIELLGLDDEARDHLLIRAELAGASPLMQHYVSGLTDEIETQRQDSARLRRKYAERLERVARFAEEFKDATFDDAGQTLLDHFPVKPK